VCVCAGGGSDDWRTTAGYTQNLDRLTVYVDSSAGSQSLAVPDKTCGFVSRLNDAVFKRRLYVQCVRPLTGRHVYIEASGVPQRRTRLFSAVLCEVLVHQWWAQLAVPPMTVATLTHPASRQPLVA